MGQAFDGEGRELGSAMGATKKEVFDTLMKEHPDAAEIRIKSLPPHTKLNPGPYDCYARLREDEPFFVLRAKDPDAPQLVEMWAELRKSRPGNEANPKVGEARQIAFEMRKWRTRNVADA